ncbi:putative ATP-binding protein involved in virulence [Runella defluvii]|uniref:Putative ATP-binding protein involved in virulence n=1 Tax=Runella defluvii TaxID=370973 RepID=A0A7W6ET44_9BACT|nr:AAA family ATPase [Runella defluvii]MBB3841217.1 putative ATP-binding protein involved in virulence [Runella defluvii]
MFLKKIRLQDFKCLADIEISFEKTSTQNRQWTLILGENGTGKSNVLKAIALVTAGSNALGELLSDTDSWIRNNQNSCRIDATLGTKKGEIREISLIINRKDNYSNIISNNKESLRLIDDAIEHADRNYFIVAYGASRRLPSENFSNFEKSSNGNRSGNVRSLFNNAYSLNPLTSWIIDLDYRSGEQGIAIVKEALDDFLPSASFHSIDKFKKQVLFKTIDGIVPLDYLSDGYQNMAAWIGDLLYRITETFKDYQNPLAARGVLLIDEIDLHLHPKWQRRLIDFITRKLPNFQVIATTHSPLTAQQVDEGELYALKRDDKNQIQLIPFIGTPKNLLINQLLMTPVFGLETDESWEMEENKAIYNKLKNKEKKSEEEHEKLRNVERKLKKNLPKRAMPETSEKSLDLLKRIEANLNIQ